MLFSGGMAGGGIDSGGDLMFSGFSIGGATSTASGVGPSVPGLVPTLVPADPLPDRDGDGMPDAWESEHGLDSDAADGDEDPDGDGLDSRSEYIVGTLPRSVASRFALPPPIPTGTGWLFSARSEPGRIYRLWSSDSMQAATWELEAVAPGSGAEVTLVAPWREGARRFYVLEVRIP